uniref:Uncharacterized protein n=1 Tax=Spongospora subterranea TaxID=70186 RepID=A0A0H5R0M4_9EUKA|eukprot:CRZ07763.1 hypothetical protein [Spongospora subterranea]
MAQREYLARLRRRLHAAWKISEQTAADVYRAAKDRYNTGRMDVILDVGRLVWVTQVASAPVLEERQSRRFLPRLTGPWRVLSRHENATDTYRLRHVTTGKEASFNVDQMVPVRIDDDEAMSAGTISKEEMDFEPYDPADFESSEDDDDQDGSWSPVRLPD